jgi:NtrC-family two-component system response regulator AlgB
MWPRAIPSVVTAARGAAVPGGSLDGCSRAPVLIVDDEADVRTELATHLERSGCTVETAMDLPSALRALALQAFDVVFVDVRVAGIGDVGLLEQMRERRPDAAVVLMTVHATVPQAVHAIQAGACDYLVKPLAPELVEPLLRRILAGKAPCREQRAVDDSLGPLPILESAHPAMQRAIATARQVAASDVPVLLTGESGTGKNVLATYIHGSSPRRRQPFVPMSCAALADHLTEGEFLEHVQAAFIDARKNMPGRPEAAVGGTLFLDEVADVPRQVQGKLALFLAEQRFERVGAADSVALDARVIAATNRDLEAEVSAGRFREDLFFRLNVVTIALPPLRERREDLVALTDHVLARLAARYHRGPVRIAPEVRRILGAHRWPGNARELVNVLERALVLSSGGTITPEHLPDGLLAYPSLDDAGMAVSMLSLEELERRHIQRVLADSGTLEEAAARLGINPTTLWRKRKRYGRIAATPALPHARTGGHRRPRRGPRPDGDPTTPSADSDDDPPR